MTYKEVVLFSNNPVITDGFSLLIINHKGDEIKIYGDLGIIKAITGAEDEEGNLITNRYNVVRKMTLNGPIGEFVKE